MKNSPVVAYPFLSGPYINALVKDDLSTRKRRVQEPFRPADDAGKMIGIEIRQPLSPEK